MHSHDHGSVRSDAPPSQGFALDPVCGMPLDTSAAKYKHSHAGRRWYFCSQHCLDKFAAEPERYAKAAGKPASPPVAGAIYTCPMHPEIRQAGPGNCPKCGMALEPVAPSAEDLPNPELVRSEEHTSELQSQSNLVCRLLLEKKKKKNKTTNEV